MLFIAAETDEFFLKQKVTMFQSLSVSFQLTPLPRGEAWLCAPREKDVAVYSWSGTTPSPTWRRRNVISDLLKKFNYSRCILFKHILYQKV